MATTLVKVDGTEVSIETTGNTVNVFIQQSSLSHGAKAMAAAVWKWLRQKAPAPRTPERLALAPSPGRAQCSRKQQALGGVQILLGMMYLGLGFLHNYLQVRGSGAPFWTGILFIVSGALYVLSRRRRGGFWVVLAALFNLASVVAGSVASEWGLAQLPSLGHTPSWINSRRAGGDRLLGPHWSPDSDWRVEIYRDWMRSLLSFVDGLQALLLISAVVALGTAYGMDTLIRSLTLTGTPPVKADPK